MSEPVVTPADYQAMAAALGAAIRAGEPVDQLAEQLHAAYLALLEAGTFGATTPIAGLPYPAPTDPVAAGADNFQALATTLDTLVNNTIATPASAGFAGAYPMGVSIAATASTDAGWPTPVNGVVVTIRHPTGAVQWWYRLNTSSPEVWVRTLLSTSASAWQQVVGSGLGDYVILNATSSVTVPTGTWTLVGCTTLESSYGSTVTQSGGAAAVTPKGLYDIDASVAWSGGGNNTAGPPIIGVGATTLGSADTWTRSQLPPPGNGALYQSARWMRAQAAGTNIAIWVLQASGANQTVTNRRLAVRRVGNIT
jgi:hypothetical protein